MVGRPFEKGRSGNPGGRAKENPEVKTLARQNAPRAIKRIIELMDSKDERVALAAANAILDRAYGKPRQNIDAPAEHRFVAEIPLAQLTTDEWLSTCKPQQQ